MIRFCGIYSTASGIYPRPRKISIDMETVVTTVPPAPPPSKDLGLFWREKKHFFRPETTDWNISHIKIVP